MIKERVGRARPGPGVKGRSLEFDSRGSWMEAVSRAELGVSRRKTGSDPWI